MCIIVSVIMDETYESIQYHYEDEEIYQETLRDLWVYCILPSVTSIYHIFFKIILVNLLFGFIVSTETYCTLKSYNDFPPSIAVIREKFLTYAYLMDETKIIIVPDEEPIKTRKLEQEQEYTLFYCDCKPEGNSFLLNLDSRLILSYTYIVKLPQTLFHLLSGFSGIYLLNNLESSEGKIIILTFFTQSYLLLHIGCYLEKKYDPVDKHDSYKIRLLSNSNIVKYCLIVLLVSCEYFLLKSGTWMEIRGIIMIFSMKLISLAEDVGKGVTDFPTCMRYFGYIFCGSNVMFGPWISFQEYIVLYHNPTKKNYWWIIGILRAVVISVIFLITSNCLANYFIKDDASIWLVAYKEALTFRTSHYFICYLSEASMLAAGFKNYKIWYEPKQWRYILSDPTKIEFPTALAIVVTNWNRPMHDFLKRYIYKTWLPLGKFSGILATFIISSFLHGFELKVSVVLITIGIFSYLQFAVRNYFANAFNCCIRVYPCKTCTHKYKRNSAISRICQLVFVLTSVLHLIYLGMIMDSSTDEIGIYGKWKDLYFISFWIMICKILIIV